MRVVHETTETYFVLKNKETGVLFKEFTEKTPENPDGVETVSPQSESNGHSWVEEAWSDHNDSHLNFMIQEYHERLKNFAVTKVECKTSHTYVF